MFNKSGTLSFLWTSDREAASRRKGISALVVGLSALALAVVAALLVTSAVEPGAPAATAGGVDINAARWEAMARYYSAMSTSSERSAAASVARWNGLAAHYGRAAAASSARWNGLATAYALDCERSAAASAARWNGLAAHYGRAAAASSARYQGLAEWYIRKAGSGE